MVKVLYFEITTNVSFFLINLLVLKNSIHSGDETTNYEGRSENTYKNAVK